MTIQPITPRKGNRNRNFVLRVNEREQGAIHQAAEVVGISASDFVRIAIDEKIERLRS